MAKKRILIIKPYHISIIMDIKQKQASRKYQQVKDALNRQKHQELTFAEFASYLGISLEDMYAQL